MKSLSVFRLVGTLLALSASTFTLAESIDDFSVSREGGNGFAYVSYSSRWPAGVVSWFYNPDGQPANFSTDQVLSAINAAMTSWTQGCGLQFVYKGITNASVISKDGVTAMGWGNARGAAGYTSVWWNDNHQIIEGDAVFDASKIANLVDFQALVTHELGHLLGLTHSDQPRSIMFSNPYHPYTYQNQPKGDDFSACALLYGGGTLVDYTDLLQEVVHANSAYDLKFYVTTSTPTSTQPSASVQEIPADFGQTAYFTVYYKYIPIGRSLKLRLVTPDGYAYSEYAWTNAYSSAYYYFAWSWATNNAIQRLPGQWKYQLLDQGVVIGEQAFGIASGYQTPLVPPLALVATANGSGNVSLSSRVISDSGTLASASWLLDQTFLGDVLAGLTASPGTGDHQLWLLANSGNGRYDGSAGSGASSQDDGPDNGLRIDQISSLVPNNASFSGTITGTRASLSLDGLLTIPATGAQQIYVAASVGSITIFKNPSGWSDSPLPLLSATGPGWAAMNILTREDVRALPSGIAIYLGYGTTLDDVVANKTFGQAVVLP